MVIGDGIDTSDVSFSDGRPVVRAMCANGRAMHLIMADGALGYLVCDKDGRNVKSYKVQMMEG